jgi:3-hydroxy-3-methylglutaryl CoA synthase
VPTGSRTCDVPNRYGSGLAATQFSIKVEDGAGAKEIAQKADVHARLAARTKISPEKFTEVLANREESCVNVYICVIHFGKPSTKV